MKKRVINTEKLSEIVKDRLLGDGGLIPEHKINKIIKEYLSERNEFLDDETPLEDKLGFSDRSVKAFDSMIEGITEMIGDLEFIKTRESDVLVQTDFYADEYLSGVITTLEGIKEDFEYLSGLKETGEDEDEIDEL